MFPSAPTLPASQLHAARAEAVQQVQCAINAFDNAPAVLDLTCYPAPGQERMETIVGEVSVMLNELAEQEPQAAELLHGRTFARTVH